MISHPENLADTKQIVWESLFDDGEVYVGVTAGKIQQRWRDHKALRARDNQQTSRFIAEYGYDFEDCFRVIFEGTEDQCYRLEYHLRSRPDMGMNSKVGGKMKHRKTSQKYFDMIHKVLD